MQVLLSDPDSLIDDLEMTIDPAKLANFIQNGISFIEAFNITDLNITGENCEVL